MLIRNNDLKVTEYETLKGGLGTVKMTHITDEDGLCGIGRLYSVIEMEPGSSIGSHIHENDFEIFYILEGEAEVTDDGETKMLYPGDVLITHEGHEHSIKNVGEKTLKFVALIPYV